MKAIVIVILMMVVVMKTDDDIDYVIDMLLNGVLPTESVEGDTNEPEPKFVGGIWKCGNCSNLNDADMVHSQTNEVLADKDYISNVEVQVSLSLDAMRCITVTAERAGAVKKVLGSCSGPTITLSLAASNYTILVYN